MSNFKKYIVENSTSEAAAKRGYDKIVGRASAIGSHKGNARVYYRDNSGKLKRSFVGDYNHHSYADSTRTTGRGHYFAMHYSARPGHDVYTHVKLPLHTDLSNRAEIKKHIEQQNPHIKGTGHSDSLAHDIVQYHGKD